MPRIVSFAIALALIFAGNHSPAQTTPRSQPAAPVAPAPAVIYVNHRFGFCFRLPPSWAGFKVLVRKQAGSLEGSTVPTRFVSVIIRHPLWTEDEPREDIPIMVFTKIQWKAVQNSTFAVSAAPFPPSELGHNRHYVFALPPRFDYDFSTGFEEVEQIVASRPLRGF